jgi:hypothetical protein
MPMDARTLRRGLTAAAFSAALSGSVAHPLAAQQPESRAEPPRPALPAGGDAHDWEAYFDRGVQLFRQDAREAGAHFYWASRLDPSRAEPYFARWANFLYRTSYEETYAYLRRAREMRERPDVLHADSLHLRALMRNPFVHRGLEILVYDRLPGRFDESRDTRAWIAYSAGNFQAAIANHTRTIDRGGARALWARYDRSLAHVAAGNMAAALEDLRALLDGLRAEDEQELVGFYTPKHHILYMIGLVRNQMRDGAAARAAFGEAIVEDASFAYAYAGLASLSRAGRQHAQAASEYAQAIELAPDDGYLRYLHAQALFDLQRYAAARGELERAIALEPHYAAPHHLLGRVLERQGHEAEAYEHFERFVRLSSARDPVAQQMRFRLDLRARSPQEQ